MASEELPTNRVELLLVLKGFDVLLCPACGEGRMEVVEKLRRQPAARGVPTKAAVPAVGKDTS